MIEITEEQIIKKKFAWIPIQLESGWTFLTQYYHVKKDIRSNEHSRGYSLHNEQYNITINLSKEDYFAEKLSGNILQKGEKKKYEMESHVE